MSWCVLQPTIDEKIQLVPKAQLGSWGKGSSGGAKASEMGKSGQVLTLHFTTSHPCQERVWVGMLMSVCDCLASRVKAGQDQPFPFSSLPIASKPAIA